MWCRGGGDHQLQKEAKLKCARAGLGKKVNQKCRVLTLRYLYRGTESSLSLAYLEARLRGKDEASARRFITIKVLQLVKFTPTLYFFEMRLQVLHVSFIATSTPLPFMQQ